MAFDKFVNQYFHELKKEVSIGRSSGQATNELSYRTSLDNFFKSVAENIDSQIGTILEPKNQSKIGRPDWRFHNIDSMGVYGYVEAKGLDQESRINTSIYKDQIDKYLILGNPIILTDGIDFVLFSPDKKIEIYSICNKPINWQSPVLNYDIEVLFQRFFNQAGYREISENQLIDEVAKRARLLSNELIELLELDEDEAESDTERITLKLLKELKETAEESHDKSLINNETFAGFISQILTFGLLYAHRVISNSSSDPKDKYVKIHDFWFSLLEEEYSNKLIPFKTLVNELKGELNSELSRLGIWYDDLRRLLAHIHLSNNQIILPDFHSLYETFLSVYDRKTRFDYGAFYTPRPLAFYTANFVKQLVRKSLPEIDLETAVHKIIDPCCGTGTFIEAVLENFTLDSKSIIIGFEILPAPYALAHYRISMLREKYPENIKIMLTNTLSNNLYESSEISGSDITAILAREQQTAYQLSCPPLTLIIGNPPSSDSKFAVSNEGSIVQALLEDFRPKVKDRSSRQNIQKQLSNEFIKFLRWSVDRAIRSTPSVFSLILPSSFAKHPSYKYARKYLSEHFNELWVLEFDSDKRKGSKDYNIFKTLQGRLLLTGIVKTQPVTDCSVYYLNICDRGKEDKTNFFEQSVELSEWNKLNELDDNYSLKPNTSYDSELYDKFWPLTSDKTESIFLRHCSSLKLAPTHLLVHASAGQLKRRSRFISKTDNDYDSIKDKWYSGQMKPPPKAKINDKIKLRLEKSVATDSIFKYSYRPFLETYVLLDEKLLEELSNLGGGGTRDRPEIRAAYKDNRVFGIAVAPAPEDIGNSLHKFSSFCWHIPDNDLSTRGNAHIFCNYFPEYKKKNSWDSSLKTNINSLIIENLSKIYEILPNDLIDYITFYSYAILSSNLYLEKFKAKLYNVAGEWPRIPITKDKDKFLKVAEIGKLLAQIESISFNIDKEGLEPLDFEYYKYKIQDNFIKLLDENGTVLKEIAVSNTEVLNFELSGYNVVREWLKIHSYAYYRKKIEKEETEELSNLLAKIEIYLMHIQTLDKVVGEIILGELYSHKQIVH